MDLPAEVLLMIFDWTSQARPVEVPDDGFPEFSGVFHVHEMQITASSMRNLALVCRRWLEVLAMKPEHWKHLKINIDGPTFIPAVIETFFVASRNNTIEVTVYPREFQPRSLTAAQEQDRWAFIMQHMTPHLGRLSRLSIDAYFRSTIVFISRFLDGATLTLEELELKSQETNNTSPLQISTLHCPNIDALHTDAESFINLMDANVEWPSRHKFHEICITHYRPEPPLSAASPSRLMAALKKHDGLEGYAVHSVSIENVKFDPNDLPSSTPSLRSVTLLKLTDLEGPFLPVICKATKSCRGLDDVLIERCEPLSPSPLPSGNLQISDIPAGPSLLHMLQGFEGSDIIVFDCPGLDDWFLGVLSLRNQADGRFMCPRLQRLDLNGHWFSASALRRMCEARYDDPRTRIESVSVDFGSKLDDDSRDWFESHVESFRWQERKLSDSEKLETIQELLSSMVDVRRLVRRVPE